MKVAIIPAAGKGTRFHELGSEYAKTLLPFDGIPIIQRIIERLQPDFDEIRIVVSGDSPQIEKFLKSLGLSKLQIIEIPSNEPQGPGRSFMEAVKGDEDYIFLHLSDVLFELDFGEYSGNWVTTMPVSDPTRWCMINGDSHMKDKPSSCSDDYQAITGAYSFSNPQALRRACEKAYEQLGEGEFQLSHIFKYDSINNKFSLKNHLPEHTLDFGTIEEYFKNNKSDGSRYFNTISYNKSVVRKSSKLFCNKLLNEALWLKYAPREIQPFIPKIYNIDFKNPSYEMERIYSVKLRDLFIYLDRRVSTWKPITTEIVAFLDICKSSQTDTNFWEDVCKKTLMRRPDLALFVQELWDTVVESGHEHSGSLYHGDLHFNNMFFDFSKNKLTLIDPRGEFYGHWLYDIAKLAHSFMGKFDFIDSKLFNLDGDFIKIYSLGTEEVEALFRGNILSLLSHSELKLVYKTTASLFASMQPLHKDSPNKNTEFERAFHRFNSLANAVV